jgi:hypothetical protein
VREGLDGDDAGRGVAPIGRTQKTMGSSSNAYGSPAKTATPSRSRRRRRPSCTWRPGRTTRSLDDAATSQRTPAADSARASPNTVGPASYTAAAGCGSWASHSSTCADARISLALTTSPVCPSIAAATTDRACTARPAQHTYAHETTRPPDTRRIGRARERARQPMRLREGAPPKTAPWPTTKPDGMPSPGPSSTSQKRSLPTSGISPRSAASSSSWQR